MIPSKKFTDMKASNPEKQTGQDSPAERSRREKYGILACLPLISTLLLACTGLPKGMQPVSDFEIQRYLGKWYEIVRLDHGFERNLSHVSATYGANTSGGITVLNRGYDQVKKKWKSIEGKARFIAEDTIGSLKVSFFGPFYGGYHIIDLDRERYQYAVVVGPSRSYFWILARQPQMEAKLLEELLAKAGALGIEVQNVIRVDHQSPPGEL